MPNQNFKMGDRIQTLRLRRKLSIEEVSKKSGISAETLVGIEAQTISPPLGNIISLAEVFRVTVGELFEDSADAPFCIVRSDERKTVPRFNSTGGKSAGYSYESLGHQKQDRQMEPFLVTLTPAEAQQVEPNQHSGEEIIFVLEGQVKVSLADHTDILNPGDSIYYDSTLPHIVSCYGDSPATILAVIYARKEMMIL
jgi:transcriptional regulator with XRE-family HTH domain